MESSDLFFEDDDREDGLPEDYRHTKNIPDSVRQAVMRRDNYRCRRCGREDGLTLHHVVPRGRTILAGGVHTEDNLVVVCWLPCHSLIEDGKVTVKRIRGDWYFSQYP